ncbi:histidine kinase [Desulfotruncus alcoholivorax]|uniref:histidine kinase n=1 Tax=Desulfotruncus alcoholivorax TaxID=265477 RepID=UPI000E099AD0|nr:histidine kinase [Desulfotruncus alcoholivorax]
MTTIINERVKRIQELEEQIADLKKRFPAHSIKPEMVNRLEELEDELERLKDNN